MALQIGITGGIGSGKSLITKIFSLLNIPIYDADSRAKILMAEDPVLVQQIQDHFGEEAYREDGRLNRTYLASRVFNDPQNIALLNSLVHPRVGSDFQSWGKARENAPYVIKEAALLFESGSAQQLDKIITVFAPEAMRIERTLKRDKHRSRRQVLDIMSNQWDENRKIEKADFVIYNDGSQLVIPQVLALDKVFRNSNQNPT